MTDANDPVDAAPDYAQANGWDREHEAFGDFDLPTAAGTPVRSAGRWTRPT